MCHTLHPYYTCNDKWDEQQFQYFTTQLPIAHSLSQESLTFLGKCQYNKMLWVKYKDLDFLGWFEGRGGAGRFLLNSRQWMMEPLPRVQAPELCCRDSGTQQSSMPCEMPVFGGHRSEWVLFSPGYAAGAPRGESTGCGDSIVGLAGISIRDMSGEKTKSLHLFCFLGSLQESRNKSLIYWDHTQSLADCNLLYIS